MTNVVRRGMRADPQGAPLVAGRELDALIAERVMGWKRCAVETHGPDCGYWWENDLIGHNEPPFSTDIAAAWEVVTALDAKGLFVTFERRGERRTDGEFHMRWACGFWPDTVMREAETAPLAICLAALQAVGVGRAAPQGETP